MLNGKQRAFLRSQANALDTIYQIGKDGVGQKQLEGIEDALKARELIKLCVLETCPVTAREAAGEVCSALAAEPVQVIGNRFVIYRRNPDIGRYKL